MVLFRKQISLYLLLVFPLVLLITACDPIQDDALSPPIVGDPLHSCAEIIAYSGANRDAEIWVYINGSKVHQFKTWMGWGEAKLPVKLDLGDKVTLRQVVNNRISSHSREEITVVDPPRDSTGERLTQPKIEEPLIECQKLVIVGETVQGATTKLNKNSALETKGMSPYTKIRLGVPELQAGDIYEAKQSICTKSGWTIESLLSDKAEVKLKPSELPKPKIHKPLVEGNDACQVDDLFIGARVEIHAKDTSGDVVVGGGTALAGSTIFGVNPVLDSNKEYYAVQYLCTLSSPPSDTGTPIKNPPVPKVQEPICKDTFYVTICDTVVMSTVKVYIDGVQVTQGAGNGGCVRMALGDATTFPEGKKVTATQTVATKTSPTSIDVLVKADGAAPYDAGKWNDPAWVGCNNCYNYGCDIRTDNFAQPGHASGVYHSTDCSTTGNAAEADGLIRTDIEKKCLGCTHLVALVIAPAWPTDYHWYRLDEDGRWSHKPGGYPATNKDASNNLITNPETADRRTIGPDYTIDYNTFCGYYCVDKGAVQISGSRSCN